MMNTDLTVPYRIIQNAVLALLLVVICGGVVGNRIDIAEQREELRARCAVTEPPAAPDMTAYDMRLDTIEKHQLGILAVLDLASRNDETLDKRDQEFLAIILIIQKELIEQRALIEKLSDTTPSYVEKD